MERDGNKCYLASLAFYWFLLFPSQECKGLAPKGWADWVIYSEIITHLRLAGLGRKDASLYRSLWALIQPDKSGMPPNPPHSGSRCLCHGFRSSWD